MSVKTPPNPLSWEQFQNRVSTYTISGWYLKPYSINPMICSRYGYELYGNNLIKCVDCGAKLSVKAQASTFDQEESATKHFKRLLQFDSHDKSCIFYRNSSPRTFLLFAKRERITTRLTHVEEFHEQMLTTNIEFFSSLKLLLSQLKSYNITALSDSFYQEYGHYYSEANEIISRKLDLIIRSNDDYTRYCFFTCLFGWKLSSTFKKVPAIQCDYCRVNKLLIKDLTIDPHSDHRWWCPVIHEVDLIEEEINDEQQETFHRIMIREDLPGWKQTYEALSYDEPHSTCDPIRLVSITDTLQKRFYGTNMSPIERYKQLISIIDHSVSAHHVQQTRIRNKRRSNAEQFLKSLDEPKVMEHESSSSTQNVLDIVRSQSPNHEAIVVDSIAEDFNTQSVIIDDFEKNQSITEQLPTHNDSFIENIISTPSQDIVVNDDDDDDQMEEERFMELLGETAIQPSAPTTITQQVSNSTTITQQVSNSTTITQQVSNSTTIRDLCNPTEKKLSSSSISMPPPPPQGKGIKRAHTTFSDKKQTGKKRNVQGKKKKRKINK